MSIATSPQSSRVAHRAFGLTATSSRFFRFYLTVAAVQGIHVIEHVIQLVQVYVFHVPSEEAFGLLGYVFNFQGTAEWMHLVFNAMYLASLCLLVIGVFELAVAGIIPRWAYRVFLIGGVGIESRHFTEHLVIIYHVVRNSGCPCPGIGDQALNISDVQLHFAYNTIAYSATLVPLVFIRKHRNAG